MSGKNINLRTAKSVSEMLLTPAQLESFRQAKIRMIEQGKAVRAEMQKRQAQGKD